MLILAKCIRQDILHLTKDKIYEIREESEVRYYLKNDVGVGNPYLKEYFEVVEDKDVKDVKVINKDYDYINPNHYKQYPMEVIDMMIAIFGKESTRIYCLMTAFKYRMRLGNKPAEPVDRDVEKMRWYENKAKELIGDN